MEFDKEIIDMNHAKFQKCKATGQPFVPIQEEKPTISISPSSGTFTTNDMAAVFAHLEGLPAQVMQQDQREVRIQYPTKQLAHQAFISLEKLHTLMITSSCPLFQKAKDDMKLHRDKPPEMVSSTPDSSATSLVPSASPMEVDLPTIVGALTASRFDQMENELNLMKSTIHELTVYNIQAKSELSELTIHANTSALILQQILEKLNLPPPTTKMPKHTVDLIDNNDDNPEKYAKPN